MYLKGVSYASTFANCVFAAVGLFFMCKISPIQHEMTSDGWTVQTRCFLLVLFLCACLTSPLVGHAEFYQDRASKQRPRECLCVLPSKHGTSVLSAFVLHDHPGNNGRGSLMFF